MSLSARIARSLESGRGGIVSSTTSRAWSLVSSRTLARRATFRAGARVIAVGGSTLGGSGKTPVAIACAKTLAELGHRVAFVGHAYGARPGTARVVTLDDPVSLVGDEALVACRSLSPLGVPIVVAPSRQAALDLALSLADVAVIDGVLQLQPVRALVSILALHAREPWGSGACPPAGDLRAGARSLLDVCDRVVVLGGLTRELSALSRPTHEAEVVARGALAGGSRLSWDALRKIRVGLFTTVARPHRIEEQLRSEGVHPRLRFAAADHGTVNASDWRRLAREGRDRGVELWLCTAKCAEHLRRHSEGTPLAVLEQDLVLDAGLTVALKSAMIDARTPRFDGAESGLG